MERSRFEKWSCLGQIGAVVLALLNLADSRAATVWTGPTIKFTQSSTAKSDVILDGKVVFNRGNRDVLYNTAAGEKAAGNTSPVGTEWAFGELSDFANLTYDTLESYRNGNLRALILNQPMVLHLIDDDIYLAITFTAWGTHLAGGFAYTRSTPAVATAEPPTVSITSPAAGASFTAPASIELTADATVTGGSVTNVAYFAGTNLLGSATASPFRITGTLAEAGAYDLTAVATAAGLSTTSSVVNVTIVAPSPLSLSGATYSSGAFSFQFNADLGASYLIATSSNLLSWLPLSTNLAASNPAVFQDSSAGSAFRFYRVSRLPNP